MIKRSLLLLAAVALTATASMGEVVLPNFITDNMVVQQQSLLTIPGHATPGITLTITPGWAAKPVKVKVAADGTFKASLPTPAAGGPYCIVISGDDKERVIDNVLSGEVWLCSGQSNMEFPMNGWTSVMNQDVELNMAHHPEIRLLQVTKAIAYRPASDCAVNMGGWVECSAATLPQFSAIAYLYARELASTLRVPVGVIDATWGGTPAEAWTSLEGVREVSGFEEEVDAMTRCGFDADQLRADYDKRIGQWMKMAQSADDAADRLPRGKIPTGSNWENTVLPSSFDGIVRISREVDIPASLSGQPLTLHLGAIDDEDVTYYDGVEIGRTSGYNTPRVYTIPASLVKAGKATICIRVTDTGGGGGFNGGDELRIDGGGISLPLDGEWDYSVAVDFATLPAKPIAVGGSGYPTVLYNAMIHPLASMPIKGVIWYQGCANVGRDAQYEPLFQTMIGDWRRLWGSDFPFYFVQLAGFLAPSYCQPDSEWAALRNAQAKALRLDNTAMATAIDLGNPADIHPRDKQSVAHRLALIALGRDYGKATEWQAPALVAMDHAGGKLTLTFDRDVVPTTVAVTGFIVAGSDGKFFTATGRQVGPRAIELSSPRVATPVSVRYDWADYPNGNLYGTSGLPVAPFATDK